MATLPPPKKKRQLTENISTDSSTAQYTGGVGSSNVSQTSSGGGGGGSRENTVAVNPFTYEPDPNSTFRVPESQVKAPRQTVVADVSSYGSGSGLNGINSSPPRSGSQSTTSVNPLIKSLIRGEVTAEDIRTGRARDVSGVILSGNVAGKLARESDKPMSIRQDVNYKYEGVVKRQNLNTQLQSTTNNGTTDRRSVGKDNILFNASSSRSNNVVSKTPQEQRVEGAKQYFKEAALATSRGTQKEITAVKDFLISPIKVGKGGNFVSSPFRNLANDQDVKQALIVQGSVVGTALFPQIAIPVSAAFTLRSGKELTSAIIKKDYAKQGAAGADLLANVLPEIVVSKIVSKPKIDIKSNVVLKQTSFGKSVVGEAKISGKASSSQKILGVVPLKKEFKLSGSFIEEGKISSVVGLKSQEPIIFTQGSGFLQIKPSRGSTIKSTVKTSGNEVAGFGQRKVLLTTKTFGKKTVKENFVESFVGVSKNDDTIFGGGVSRKGSDFYVGKKMLEVSSEVPTEARYFNSQLGLESATPTLELLQGKDVKTIKLFDVRSASQSDIGFSAKLTRAGVRQRLLEEKSSYDLSNFKVDVGSVSDVSRQQLSTSNLINLKNKELSLFNYRDVVKKQLESSETFKSPSLKILSESKNVNLKKSSDVVSSETSFVNPSYVFHPLSSNRVLKSNLSQESNVDVISKSQFANIGVVVNRRKSSSDNDLVNKSIFANALRSDSDVALRSLQSPKLDSVSKQRLFSELVFASPSRSRFRFAFDVPVRFGGFVLPKRKSGGLFSVDVRSKGKFVSVGEGLNLKDAIKLGKGLTGGSSARSFKIKTQAGKSLKGLNIGGDYYKKGDVYIEKSKYAINAPNEFKSITYEGLRTLKRKRLGVF